MAAVSGARAPSRRTGPNVAGGDPQARCRFGSVGYEAEPNERGERLIWLAPAVIDRLRAMRGPGESYSDVILRIKPPER